MFFDKQTGLMNLDEHLQLRPTFQKIMLDQKVTDKELDEQANMVITLLKELEETFAPADLQKVNNVLAEMGVLYAVSQIKQLQDLQQ